MGRRAAYTVPGLQAELKRLPKHLSGELRDASMDISVDVARGAEGRRDSRVARLVPVRPRRDRVPKVVMGGSAKLPPRASGARRGNHQTVGDVMWGANFGSRRYTQFPEVERPDHFLYRTVDVMSDDIMDRYGEALGNTLAKI